MVIMNCIEGLKEEFEERLGDQSPWFYDDEQLSWFEKKNKELSSLRQQLDAISKSLSFPEIGHISSHGSMEIGEECNNNKRTDHLHRKVSGASLWKGYGKHDESVIAVPENLDYGQLQHMTKEALVSYFKTQMTNMKRNHELKVQEMTEENFSLKRKCLRERGSSLPFKTDKEFDTLRKKTAEVILKLDDNLSDNRQLRGMITDMKSKVKRLSSQVSDTSEIMLQHSVAKENLVKRIGHLQSALVDACIESSITDDVYKCLLRGVVNSNSSVRELSDIESSSTYDFEDSAMESIIMQELCGIIFKQSLKEAKEKLFDLNLKYTNEHELRVHVETEASQKEEALSLEVSEKEKLKQQTCFLSSLMEAKDKVAQEAAAALVKQKEQFELVSRELKNLRNETSRQEMLISERSKESDAMKRELSIALEKIEGHKLELRDLRDKFTLKMNEIGEIDVSQEKEREHKRQIQSLTILVQCLYTRIADFECRVMEDITKSNTRLDNLSSQLRALIRKAKVIKGTELMYKQRLERRSSDLQKAEAEVDLLGDKVDALSSLLEKIYMALDHYSPVLQHYSGVIETLKLVRRELGGKFTKPA